MINRKVKTRVLFTHPQLSAINSNLHNTSHNEAPRSRLVFSMCFDDVFRGNNGDINVNAEWKRVGLRSPPDYAGLNGMRAAGARGATICADYRSQN